MPDDFQFNFRIDGWQEVKFESQGRGNVSCPRCSGTMVLIPTTMFYSGEVVTVIIAWCPRDGKQYIGWNQEREGDYDG